MCVLPIRGRPLPRPVPVLDLTLLMFEWLLIFQLFSQPAMTQLIRKYDSSLGDWIPLLQNCGILTQILKPLTYLLFLSLSLKQSRRFPLMSVNLRDERSKRNCPRLDPGPGPEPRPAAHPLVARVSGNCCRTRLLSQHQSGWTKLPSVKTTFG